MKYKTLKVFDTSLMQDEHCQYLHWLHGEDEIIRFHISTEDEDAELDDIENEIKNWLLNNGAEVGETVLIEM
jgi:hypothetical protein